MQKVVNMFTKGHSITKVLAILSVAYILLVPVVGFGKGASKSSRSPKLLYGMAGCGGGISLFPNDTPLSQLGITSVRLLPNVTALTGAVSMLIAALNGSNGALGLVLYLGGTAGGLAMSPTVGMTFGTSNCAPNDSKSIAVMEQELYLAINRNVLEREAVRGQGEHITALSWLMGCRTQMGHAAFAQTMQVNFATIFADNNSNETLQQLVATLHKEPYLAKNCRII